MTPGDGLGAAGLDSSMYSHLRRNWSFAISQKWDRPITITHKWGQPITPSHASDDTADNAPDAGGTVVTKRLDCLGTSANYQNYLMSTTQNTAHQTTRPTKKQLVYKTRRGEDKIIEIGLSVLTKEERKRQRATLTDKSKGRSSLHPTKKLLAKARFAGVIS